jgi:hypothetical protein
LSVQKNILALLDDQQGDDFQPKLYLEHFAPYLYTYIAGYAALVDALVAATEFRNHKSVLRYVSGQSEFAACCIPSAWKDAFDSKEWDGCTEAQVTKAYNGDAKLPFGFNTKIIGFTPCAEMPPLVVSLRVGKIHGPGGSAFAFARGPVAFADGGHGRFNGLAARLAPRGVVVGC